jgi:hypothetical protein
MSIVRLVRTYDLESIGLLIVWANGWRQSDNSGAMVSTALRLQHSASIGSEPLSLKQYSQEAHTGGVILVCVVIDELYDD